MAAMAWALVSGAASGGTPAGTVNRPLLAEIATDTYVVNEFGADAIYVIVGKRRALVVDSGSGFCDLKAIIESLTPLPYDVVLTHGHPDHAGGIGQFEAVHIDPADIELARGITYAQRVEYGRIMRSMTSTQLGMSIGFANLWAYSDADVRQWDRTPAFVPLRDGQVFDLGGRRVTAYHVGVHTPGSTVFLDDRSRILFSGDAANPILATTGTVSSVLRGLLKIQGLGPRFERMYNGHTAYASMLEPFSENRAVLGDAIAALRAVLRGDADLRQVPSHLFPERMQTVAVHGRAQVQFDPSRLWGPGESRKVP